MLKIIEIFSKFHEFSSKFHDLMEKIKDIQYFQKYFSTKLRNFKRKFHGFFF